MVISIEAAVVPVLSCEVVVVVVVVVVVFKSILQSVPLNPIIHSHVSTSIHCPFKHPCWHMGSLQSLPLYCIEQLQVLCPLQVPLF